MTTPPQMPAIRVAMMPKDTNAHGTIFGGVILSYIDQAGAFAARAFGAPKVVTVSMKEVQFRQPVYVGDIVSFYTDVERLGNTSITVRVTVRAERYRSPGSDVLVTDAEVVYVGVDENFNKVPIRRPVDPA